MAQRLLAALLLVMLISCSLLCASGRSVPVDQDSAQNSTGSHSCMYRWLQVLPTTPKIADINHVENIFRVFAPTDELNVEGTSLRTISAAIGDDTRAQVFVDCLSGRLEVCRQSRPCNAGKCLFVTPPSTHRGSYQCQCDSGYTGQFCETGLPSCSGNTCQNGGTCEATATSYQCKCPPHYSGRHCERRWFDERKFDRLSETVLRVSQDVQLLKEETRNTSSQGLTRIEQFLRRLEQRVETSLNTSLSEMQSRISHLEMHPSLSNITNSTERPRDGQVTNQASQCLRGGQLRSGVFTGQTTSGPYTAYCDRETDGGGWIVFQRRQDGSVDFYRDWSDYKQGFGSASGEFWLGLDNLHSITSQSDSRYELRIDIVFATSGEKHNAKYTNFSVGNETSNYQLHVFGFSSPTLQDRMAYHSGQQFSTRDRDHSSADRHCARLFHGAWWHNSCHYVNANGRYGQSDGVAEGVTWNHGGPLAMRFVEMKLRRAL